MSSPIKGIARISQDDLFEAFSNLGPADLRNCGRVCKGWGAVSDSARLWEHLFPGLPPGTDIRELAKNYGITVLPATSEDEIVERIREFAAKVSKDRPGQKGVFTCLFLSNRARFIRVGLSQGGGSGNRALEELKSKAGYLGEKPDVEDVCIFVGDTPRIGDNTWRTSGGSVSIDGGGVSIGNVSQRGLGGFGEPLVSLKNNFFGIPLANPLEVNTPMSNNYPFMFFAGNNLESAIAPVLNERAVNLTVKEVKRCNEQASDLKQWVIGPVFAAGLAVAVGQEWGGFAVLSAIGLVAIVFENQIKWVGSSFNQGVPLE